MRLNSTLPTTLATITVLAASSLVPPRASAHCDTLDDPVAAAARVALARGDATPVLRWVRESEEPAIREAWARALEVRRLGGKGRKTADLFFIETLVRIHRAGEGEPYTGLQPEGSRVDPGLVAADRAVDSADLEPLIADVTKEIGEKLRQHVHRVEETRARADESVAAGRAFAAAHVEFIHLVERLHQAGEARAH
jgi:hypothetical protein